VTVKKSTLVEAPWWYRHVPRDFMSSPDVTMMSTEEIGAYFLLLQAAWLGGADCTLPNDLERLARLARVSALSEIVLSKFHTDEKGRLFNPRLRDEWVEALKRSEHGKNNATKRWQERMPRHSGANATALPSQCQPNATNTNTNTNIKNENKGAPAQPQPSLLSDVQKIKPPLAFTGARIQITVRQDKLLGEAFPWVDRSAQYALMESWLEANPTRRVKKFSQFAHNWFARIPAKGGSPNGQHRSPSGAVHSDRQISRKPDYVISV